MDKNKEIKKKTYIEWVIWTLLFMLLDLHGIYKYIVVSTVSVVVVLINWLKLKIILNDLYILFPTVLYCGIGLLLAIFHDNMTSWTVKTIVFWLLPPLFSLSACLAYDGKRTHMVDVQFWACVTAYLGTKIGYILINGEFESPFAFVFGTYVLYYMHSRKWNWSILAALIMFLANKRIAILAVFACLVLMAVMKAVKYEKKWIMTFWGAIIIANGAYIYAICSGVLDKICNLIGVETSYRLDVYSQLAKHVSKNYYVGKGIGEANIMIQKYVDPNLIWAFENPHNDILKTFLELGLIGFLIFLTSYLLVFCAAQKRGTTKRMLSQLFVTFAYFMMLMTTDNVSIYILFLIPMYSICLALIAEKEEFYENYAK